MRSKHSSRLDLSIFKENDYKLYKFVNLLMSCGKKNIAQKNFCKFLFRLKKEFKMSPRLKFVSETEKMVFPLKISEVVKAKIKFKTPHPIKKIRSITLQYQNIIKCSDSKADNSFFDRVTNEFVDYCKGVGTSFSLFKQMKQQIKAYKTHGRFKI